MVASYLGSRFHTYVSYFQGFKPSSIPTFFLLQIVIKCHYGIHLASPSHEMKLGCNFFSYCVSKTVSCYLQQQKKGWGVGGGSAHQGCLRWLKEGDIEQS